VARRFIDDLKAAVEYVRAHACEKGGMAPIYGLAATLPLRGMVSEMLRRYLDLLYEA
jgi:sphinganine-1-phosphate aldolase